MKLKFLTCLVAVAALAAPSGCGGAFRRLDSRWPTQSDGTTIIPYQLVREGSVQDIELRPIQVAPMSATSETAWREAIEKWNEAGSPSGVRLVEAPSRTGVLIYDIPDLTLQQDGAIPVYATDGAIRRAWAYCGPVESKSDIRMARYVRLHQIGHALLLTHATGQGAVMAPIAESNLVPRIELTSADRSALTRKYRPPP